MTSDRRNSMNTNKRLKQLALSMGIVGFVSAILLSVLSFGLGAGWYVAYKDLRISGIGPNRFQDWALRYLVISILFLLFIGLRQIRNKISLQATAILPLALALHQSRILILSRADGLPPWVMQYSSSFELLLYTGIFLFTLAAVLVVLQFGLIWLIYRSSVYDTP